MKRVFDFNESCDVIDVKELAGKYEERTNTGFIGVYNTDIEKRYVLIYTNGKYGLMTFSCEFSDGVEENCTAYGDMRACKTLKELLLSYIRDGFCVYYSEDRYEFLRWLAGE